MKIQNTLVYNLRGRSQRYFAHITTVSLSWRVQNIVVIGQAYSKLERSEFSSNFEFDRNMLSGTGARACLGSAHADHSQTEIDQHNPEAKEQKRIHFTESIISVQNINEIQFNNLPIRGCRQHPVNEGQWVSDLTT